ncbi:methyltransferase domain-containing protein [bacterium]|nr:methyltransferase domain-containing protein [bacterium]
MGPLYKLAWKAAALGMRANSVPPYGVLGAAYDHMMRHVDYKGWAEYIESLIAHFGHGRRLLDAGCGTGQLMQHLWQRGFKVAGFDRSMSMVRQVWGLGRDAVVGDICSMPFRTDWDAVLCLYDVLLYLDVESVRVAAEEAKRMLRPGGLFIFDTVTESLVLDYWRCFSERGVAGKLKYYRQSWYDKQRRIQHTRIRIRHLDNGQTWTEHHKQQIYKLDVLTSAVELSGLKIIGHFHEMSMMPGSEESGRVHFVFRREDD